MKRAILPGPSTRMDRKCRPQQELRAPVAEKMQPLEIKLNIRDPEAKRACIYRLALMFAD